MSLTNTDPIRVLEAGGSRATLAVVFHPDRKHLLGGGGAGIRRWRLAYSQEVGKQTGMELWAISVSRNQKWVVCGTREGGASVWDAEMHEKVIDVEGTKTVCAVDVSPDSTRFATGTGYPDKKVSIWSITSGRRLVGPLQQDKGVTGVRFSPDGEQIATSCFGDLVRIFDSRNGDPLIEINTITASNWPITPLAWSSDGQQIFSVSDDNKIRSFAVSTGSQLAESPILESDHASIALAPNGKFIATYARTSIWFLDTSTLSHIVPAIEDKNTIFSIAISSDGNSLATGEAEGQIKVRNLGSILPDLHGPFHAPIREERQLDELPSTSASHDNQPPGSDPQEEPRKSNQLQSEMHSETGDSGLLEVEVPTNTPAFQFDYDESPSPVSSVHSREDEVPPLDTSPAVPQPSDALQVTSPPEMSPEEPRNIIESSQGIMTFKKWLMTRIRKIKKDQALHEPDRVGRKSRQAADHQSHSQPSATVEDSNVGPSRMAATKRVPRMVATSFEVPQSDPKPTRPKKGASHSGQGVADPVEAGHAVQVNDPSQPSAGTVNLTHQRESGKATLSITFPAWLLCLRSGTEDGTH